MAETDLAQRLEALAAARGDDLATRVDALAETVGADVGAVEQRLDDISRLRRFARFAPLAAPPATPGGPELTLDDAGPAQPTRTAPLTPFVTEGVNRETGAWLSGWPHVVQSIHDIITTPVLTRVMRREYGSSVPRLIDAPTSDRVVLALYVAIATALYRWEPRFEVTECRLVDANEAGQAELSISGIYYPRGHLGDKSLSEEKLGISVWLR